MNYEPSEEYYEIDENFSFNQGINKILDAEVEKRVLSKVEGYNHAIKQNERLMNELAATRNQLRDAEKNLESAEQDFLKQGEDKAKRELFGGHLLGDKVWYLKYNSRRETCSTCLGEKKVSALVLDKEMKIACPKCEGYGVETDYFYTVNSGEVIEINVQIWAKGTGQSKKIYIKPSRGDSVQLDLEKIFKTEKDCQDALLEKETNK